MSYIHKQSPEETIAIRLAIEADQVRLRRLAQRDSRALPTAPLLIAEVDGELRAAVSLRPSQQSIADPFRPTAKLLEMLRLHARALDVHGDEPRPNVWISRRSRRRPGLRSAPATR